MPRLDLDEEVFFHILILKTEIINKQTDKTITDQQALRVTALTSVLSPFTAAKVTVLSFTQTLSVCAVHLHV